MRQLNIDQEGKSDTLNGIQPDDVNESEYIETREGTEDKIPAIYNDSRTVGQLNLRPNEFSSGINKNENSKPSSCDIRLKDRL